MKRRHRVDAEIWQLVERHPSGERFQPCDYRQGREAERGGVDRGQPRMLAMAWYPSPSFPDLGPRFVWHPSPASRFVLVRPFCP